MNIILNIQGGLGKSIMATAVVEAIKKNYPNSYLIVITHFKEVFLNNPNVNQVMTHVEQNGIYAKYIHDSDTLFMVQDPYGTSDFLNNKKHLIEIWCEMNGIKYKGEQPKLFFKKAEEQYYGLEYNSDKPIIAFQSNGGSGEIPYNWVRDIPYDLMNKIIQDFKGEYNFFHIKSPQQPAFQDTVQVHNGYRSVAFLLKMAKHLILIDSFAQHMAHAMNKKANVFWIGTNHKVFGYDKHNNILANDFTRPIYLDHPNYQPISLTEPIHTIPFNDLNEIFNLDSLYKSFKGK